MLLHYPFEPIPYSFGYAIKDVHGEQHRQEKSDGAGVVTGSYGFVDEHGIHRQVHYIADHLGFRAKIITNEPGTANQNPAGVIMESIP
ncbi:UNVERIFIED_CONTAM: Cuticle protein 10.9 [Trichonephila clavipes]